MRVFVTGAAGYIGSAVVAELTAAGHQVVGLARSDANAAALTEAGVEVRRGDLTDPDGLRAGADDSDGVIHLAFVHDFGNFAESVRLDREAIEALGNGLAGSDRPLVIASGLLALAPGRVATERDWPSADSPAGGRADNARATLALADRGVRSSVLRLPPTVHSDADRHGFIPRVIEVARERGVSGYVDDGSARWPAVHVLDAARLFRLAVESAPAGSVLHAVGDEGVPTRTIAEIIGRHLDRPVESIPRERAEEHFGWIGAFFGADSPASATSTRELTGWAPTEIGLVDDLDKGHYFAAAG